MGETSTGATPRAGSAAAGTEAGRPLSRAQSTRQALLKAVEASRARAIDSLIKEIATLADSLPEDGSKKND